MPWQAVHFGTSHTQTLPGWGWGFYLPCLSETCCGFRNEEAAAKAAKLLKTLSVNITGDLPNGVFEIFELRDEGHAFFDLHGELHCTFPTREEARGCAAKTEAVQMNGKAETLKTKT